jgi:cytoskeleton protein RodZ
MRLSLVFGGDCWTEISDADGRRLFFNMGRSGQSVELTGRPPLRALFGNADNVDVRVNGNPYTIPASARENRTARLSIQNP